MQKRDLTHLMGVEQVVEVGIKNSLVRSVKPKADLTMKKLFPFFDAQTEKRLFISEDKNLDGEKYGHQTSSNQNWTWFGCS